MKQHKFKDDTKQVQVSENEDINSTFFSIQTAERGSSTSIVNTEPVLARFVCRLGDIEVVQARVVYNVLDLLGDAGGIYASLYFLGQIVHFIFVDH